MHLAVARGDAAGGVATYRATLAHVPPHGSCRLSQIVRSARWGGVLAFAVLLVACRGSDPAAPAGGEPPSLAVTLDVGADGRSSYTMAAEFHVGTDARGNPRRIVNDTIYVDGRALFASSASGKDVRFYNWTVFLPGTGDRDAVKLRGPALEDAEAAQFLIPLPRRDGPEDVVLAAGNELALNIVPPARVSAPVTGVATGWRLALRRTCDGSDFFSRWGSGAPFVVQRVAWPLVAFVPRDSLAACFSASYDYATADAPYAIDFAVTTHIRWWIWIDD